MRYLKQFGIIIGFSFLGELCHWLIPLPIPTSIYGMALLFAALSLKLLKPEQVAETGNFLVKIMPVLFVAPTVKLMDCWSQIEPQMFKILTIIVSSTLVTFLVSGWVTQLVIRLRKGAGERA